MTLETTVSQNPPGGGGGGLHTMTGPGRRPGLAVATLYTGGNGYWIEGKWRVMLVFVLV